MSEIQSVSNLSNSNCIEQIHTVSGNADYFSKKEYLIKLKAQSRYRDLIKSAEKANMSPEQYVIKTYDCSISEYCGEDFIQSKVFSKVGLNVTPDQQKILTEYKKQVVSKMPFVYKFKDIQVIVQACLKVLIHNGNSDIYFLPKGKDYLQVMGAQTKRRYETAISKKIGIEHLFSNIYRRLGVDSNGGYKYVPYTTYITDYINIGFKFLEKIIAEDCSVSYLDQPSYKQISKNRSVSKLLSQLYTFENAPAGHELQNEFGNQVAYHHICGWLDSKYEQQCLEEDWIKSGKQSDTYYILK